MDIDAYSQAAEAHCNEILNMLDKYGIEALYNDGKTYRREQVSAYLTENDTYFVKFVRATPAQRKKFLNKVPEHNHPIFLLCALYKARCGLAFLSMVYKHDIQPGSSSRDMTAQAAMAARDLFDDYPTVWPYEDYACPWDEMI